MVNFSCNIERETSVRYRRR